MERCRILNHLQLTIGSGVMLVLSTFRADFKVLVADHAGSVREQPSDGGPKYICNLVNHEPLHFVGKELVLRLRTPKFGRPAMRVWKVNTAEFQALLGTRIMRSVAYSVMQAFLQNK
jgi:hypothetical protein